MAIRLRDRFRKAHNAHNIPMSTGQYDFLYLYRNPLSGFVKIGITKNPCNRFREIRNACGMELQDLCSVFFDPEIDYCPKFVEQFLHDCFKEKRKYGEWFELSVRDLVDIRSFISDVCDLEILHFNLAQIKTP